MYVNIEDLPICIRRVLSKVEFDKIDIKTEKFCENISLKVENVSDYDRGFCAIIDTLTGKYRIGYGSYGGANQWIKTIVDTCNYKFSFPKNVILIKGQELKDGAKAILYHHKDLDLQCNLVTDPMSYRVYKILKIMRFVSPSKFGDLLSGVKLTDIAEALKANYLVHHSKGFKVTRSGKKIIRLFENKYPDKIYAIDPLWEKK